jgi:hypothetical protein
MKYRIRKFGITGNEYLLSTEQSDNLTTARSRAIDLSRFQMITIVEEIETGTIEGVFVDGKVIK